MRYRAPAPFHSMASSPPQNCTRPSTCPLLHLTAFNCKSNVVPLPRRSTLRGVGWIAMNLQLAETHLFSMGLEYLPTLILYNFSAIHVAKQSSLIWCIWAIISGQIILFHQPRFPWNKGNSITEPPFGGNPSCEVAIIWPPGYKQQKVPINH